MKINKLNEAMIPSQAILDDCLDDYLQNAFGYNGVEDYVATQYPNHPSEWQARICDYLKQHKNESLELNEAKTNDDEFFELQNVIGAALNSIGGDMDDITGGITSHYDEDCFVISLYSTVDRKNARSFKKKFFDTINNALSQTRFNDVSVDEDRTFAYQLSRLDLHNHMGSDRGDEFASKFAMFEILITAYGRKLDEAMIIGYDEGSIKEQIRILNKNIEDYKQLIIDEPEDKDYWEEQIKKCEKEVAELQSYKPLDEAKIFGAKGEKKLQEKLTGYKVTVKQGDKTFDDYACAYEEEGAITQMKNKYGKDIEIVKIDGSRVIKEASYGGAYDIADGQYFTREDLENFADEVISCIAARDDVLFDVCDLSADGLKITIGLNNADRNGEFEHSITFRADLRSIRYPNTLATSKYVAMIADQFRDEYRKQTETLTEDNKFLPIEVLNPDGTPKQYDVKFMELEKVPGLLNWDVADQLEQHFRNNKLWVDELHYNEVKDCIEYDINWGDWKHEHLRSKWLLEELFEKLGIAAQINSHTTEEDGSDTYSAHYIVRSMGKMNEDMNATSPKIGQKVKYRGMETEILKIENDPEYGYDFLIKNPFWNGKDGRFENIWVGDQVEF